MVAKCLDGRPNSPLPRPGRSFQVQWQWREPSTVSDKFRAQHSKFLGSRALRTLNHLESRPSPTVTMTSRSLSSSLDESRSISNPAHPRTKKSLSLQVRQSIRVQSSGPPPLRASHARSLA